VCLWGVRFESQDYHELLVRWFQFAAFVPVMRYHGQGGEIWLYGDEVRNVRIFSALALSLMTKMWLWQVTGLVNQTLCLRYRLVPYLYSLANSVASEGYTIQVLLPYFAT
jgi:alpha-D-xyloside xylohydrolase